MFGLVCYHVKCAENCVSSTCHATDMNIRARFRALANKNENSFVETENYTFSLANISNRTGKLTFSSQQMPFFPHTFFYFPRKLAFNIFIFGIYHNIFNIFMSKKSIQFKWMFVILLLLLQVCCMAFCLNKMHFDVFWGWDIKRKRKYVDTDMTFRRCNDALYTYFLCT